jgi:methionyl-tRNA synthetase
MSKSLGNVIDPFEYVEKYGTDALRYYLLAKISPSEDSDFTEEKFKEVYNADLANGLGNLVARVAKLCDRENISGININPTQDPAIDTSIKEFAFDKAISNIWSNISVLDGIINREEPWKITDGKILKEKLETYVTNILNLAFNLKPFLPSTAEKIEKQFNGPKIKSTEVLFPRIK